MSMTARCAIVVPLATLCSLTGCATTPPTPVGAYGYTADATVADGLFVLHLRIEVPPADITTFETLMLELVAAARAARIGPDYHWLAYRAGTGRYDVLRFSNTVDGFTTPAAFHAMVRAAARACGGDTFGNLNRRLNTITVATVWQRLLRQCAAWSTVQSMTTATHPKARVTEYTVVRDGAGHFQQALAARTAFLRDHAYPLPIEGFILINEQPRRAWQVVFPFSWESWHRSDSVSAFAARLEPADRAVLERLDDDLASTVTAITHFDGDHAPELSFDAE